MLQKVIHESKLFNIPFPFFPPKSQPSLRSHSFLLSIAILTLFTTSFTIFFHLSSNKRRKFSTMRNPNQAPDQHQNLQIRKQKTPPTAWCLAAICTIFWVAIILGGLAVLIVYLVYKPKSPRFDIADATLNAGYLDMGTFLNADLTLLVNVVNPNHKLDMSFSYLQLDLYYQGIMIGTQIVGAFYQPRGQSSLRNVHIITSQVQMPLAVAQMWGNGTKPGGNGVRFELRGKFLTRWLFSRLLHFTTWVRRGCAILIGPPPNGEILAKQCG